MNNIQNYKLPIVARVLIKFKQLVLKVVDTFSADPFFNETSGSQVPIDFYRWFNQRILGKNNAAYWPMHPNSTVSFAKRVHVGIETSPGWSAGCYIQAVNGIYVGDYTQIAPNVGLISGNHDLYDLSLQVQAPPILIGKYCLLGMGCVVLPGVRLGDYTIVGAGAVVTRSFPEGFCVIAGSPARLIRKLDPNGRRDYKSVRPYHGYIPDKYFSEFKKQHLHAPEWPNI